MAGAVHSLWMNPLRLFGTVYELPGNCDGRQGRLVCNQVLIMNKTVGGAAVDGMEQDPEELIKMLGAIITRGNEENSLLRILET